MKRRNFIGQAGACAMLFPGVGQLLSNLGETSSSFTFAQLCDPQLGFGGYEHDMKTFRQAVVQVNDLSPDFVVICGDLVNNAAEVSFRDFKWIAKKLTMPCYCAPGNHDVGNKPKPWMLKRYRETIGEDYYAVEHKGYTFVIANTQLWKESLEGESDKHVEWVIQTVKTAAEKGSPVFMIQHYPFYTKNPEEAEQYYNLPLTVREKLLPLYKECNVVAVLSGHTHTTRINQYEGIQLVSGSTTSKNFDKRPFGFRLWTVSPSSITHEFIPLQMDK